MISKNIKDLRKEKGFTQTELAKAIGVSQGAIYFWENGINEPSAGYVIKIAEVFGVSTDDLLSYEVGAKRTTTKNAEMIKLFSELTESQQNILINTAKEMLKP